MNIKSIASKEFLIVDLFNENSKLNPFYINIDQIRCLREYVDSDMSKRNNRTNTPWAITVGEKMFATDSIEELNDIKAGDEIMIGNVKFLCVMGSSLTDKPYSRHLVNTNHILYMRKYVNNNPDPKKSNNFVSNSGENISEIDKFAVVMMDNRVLPIEDIITGYRMEEVIGVAN